MQATTSTTTGALGVTLHTVTWQPDAPPRADVMLIHGYGEHCGRYAPVVDALTAHGLRVHSLDLRGHGRSTGLERGTIDDFDTLVDDISRYADHVRSELPLFVYGHSMGGLAAVRLAERSENGFAGWILTSSALKAAASIPPLLVKVANVLGKLAPKLPTVALELEAISRTPEVRAAYDTDPLVFRGKLRAGTGRQLNLAMSAALAEASRISKPVLIMHGDADALTNVSGSRQLAESVSSTDRTLTVWPGAYHELHHEPEHARVLATVTDWIAAHLPN